MSIEFAEARGALTAADIDAERNWDANLAALAAKQPALAAALRAMPAPDVSWLYARDGSLTAHDALGRWWSGCSLPSRAAQAMLKQLTLRGVVGCLLAQTHA